jgi:putative restriction endonuclease
LREQFSNGRSYYPLHGHAIIVPKKTIDRPDPLGLPWHNEHVFQG